MESVDVYGFGSFFKNPNAANDLDVLVLHENPSESSCRFAIACKSALSKKLPRLHVTILSKPEERGNKFIEKSKAVFLGSVHNDEFKAHITKIMDKILAHDLDSI